MRYIIVFFLLGIPALSFAQKDVDFDKDPSFLERVYVGGGLGFSSNFNATVISLSPIVGYMITQNLSAGLGVQYQYVKFKGVEVSDNRYGGSIFTRYNFNQFFLQAEYNILNIELTPFDDVDSRMNLDRMLIGGGLSQPFAGRARINIVGFYDVFYNDTSFFNSPWVFRVYISG